MLESEINSKEFEEKLKVFSSGLGNIAQELFNSVGKKMADEARARASFKNRSGKLYNSIKFIFDDGVGALTTRKSLNKGNVYYAKFVEYGADIKAKKSEYLVFKIDGEWKKVKSVRNPPRPFMRPVFDDYFEGENAKGYKELANALQEKIQQELGE